MSKEKERKEDIDFISRLNGYGSLTSAQTNNLRGINLNLNGTPAPKNKDHFGFTFFTRPDLNMSYDNLGTDRMLSSLLSEDTRSLARAIRVLLDPRGQKAGRVSELIDPRMPFIPFLTNNLVSMSGWPDMVVDTYTSKEGAYKEAYSMVDGTSHIFNTFDVTANFSNIQGDPITLLFAVWIRYASLVYEGAIAPYAENLFQNTIDYQTRIYRIVLDEEYNYVQKIAACGAAFPLASPLGASFNYSNDAESNTENDQLSIPFRCIGANYLDPILVKEFNQCVTDSFGNMRDGNREGSMVKIDYYQEYYEGKQWIGHLLWNLLSHRAYPRISESMAMEWWVTKDDYQNTINQLKEKGAI